MAQKEYVWPAVRVPRWDVHLSVTIPRDLVAALGLRAGDNLLFTLDEGKLVARPVREMGIRRMYTTISGSLRVTIPEELARHLKIKRGCEIVFKTLEGSRDILIERVEGSNP